MLFVVALFFFKNKTTFKNEAAGSGLVYGGTTKIGDLLNIDTDGDGIPDWEENLLGTDPNKKDTDGNGIPDNIQIEKEREQKTASGELSLNTPETENLTETDKLSRELFSTIATLNQAGDIDQATVDRLSSSLADKIQNSAPKKVFSLSDIKVIQDDNVQAVRKYNDNLIKLYPKTPAQYTVLQVLEKFVSDENNGGAGDLSLLDPIIERSNKLIEGMLKIEVPRSLATFHLNLTNSAEKVLENLNDIKLYNTDTILALAGISQYQDNVAATTTAINDMEKAIKQKLKQ